MARALIVIDMQKAYFKHEPLASEQTKLVQACNELIVAAEEAGAPVLNLQTIHKADKSTWTLNMLDDAKGFLIAGDDDTEPVAGLHTESTVQVVKTRDSGFWNTELLRLLKDKNVREVVIAGVSTHSCIMATAMDAYNANLRLIIAKNAVASHDPSLHASALKLLRQEYRAKLVNAEEIEW